MRERCKDTIRRLLRSHPRSVEFDDEETRARTYDAVLEDVLVGLGPILDAIYYGPCPVCNDAKFIPDPETVELDAEGRPDPESLELVPCPECAARPPFMVAAESWLQAQIAVRSALRLYGYAPGRTSNLVDAVLSAALGDPPIVPLEIWPATLELVVEDGGATFVNVRISDERAIELARDGVDVVVGFIAGRGKP